MQKLIDFFHDGAQNLIELQGGGKRLTQFVEYGYFTGFPLIGIDQGIVTAFDACKPFCFCHSSLEP